MHLLWVVMSPGVTREWILCKYWTDFCILKSCFEQKKIKRDFKIQVLAGCRTSNCNLNLKPKTWNTYFYFCCCNFAQNIPMPVVGHLNLTLHLALWYLYIFMDFKDIFLNDKDTGQSPSHTRCPLCSTRKSGDKNHLQEICDTKIFWVTENLWHSPMVPGPWSHRGPFCTVVVR